MVVVVGGVGAIVTGELEGTTASMSMVCGYSSTIPHIKTIFGICAYKCPAAKVSIFKILSIGVHGYVVAAFSLQWVEGETDTAVVCADCNVG